jgi:lipopolysaccharide biosynthesis protein
MISPVFEMFIKNGRIKEAWLLGIGVSVLMNLAAILSYVVPLLRSRWQAERRILVVYSYFEADNVVKNNLQYFIDIGIKKYEPINSNVDFIIVVNGVKLSLDIPKLPNLQVIIRDNSCYDVGGYAHALENVDTKSYYYFIFMNGSVRGPFAPVYLKGIHWTSAFTALINHDVKWAGASINCESHVHVQTPIVVTDHVGLGIIRNYGSLDCPEDYATAVKKWELGSSQAILNHGYNLASLMSRYDGVDFRAPDNQRCNGELNPAVDLMNDGVGLDPFEVLFVKVKSTINMGYYDLIARHSDYAFGHRSIQLNAWNDPRTQESFKKISMMKKR